MSNGFSSSFQQTIRQQLGEKGTEQQRLCLLLVLGSFRSNTYFPDCGSGSSWNWKLKLPPFSILIAAGVNKELGNKKDKKKKQQENYTAADILWNVDEYYCSPIFFPEDGFFIADCTYCRKCKLHKKATLSFELYHFYSIHFHENTPEKRIQTGYFLFWQKKVNGNHINKRIAL